MKGQNTKSIRKKTFANQRTPLIGIKNVRFYHQSTAGGEMILNLASLVAPAGFTNPSPSEIAGLNLSFFADNFRLVSSVRGELIEGISFQVTTSTSLKLLVAASYVGEIFVGTFSNSSINGTLIADVRTPGGSGTLLEGIADFNLGEAIPILDLTNQYPIGVLRGPSGTNMIRNANNAADTSGNYQMLDRGDGWCQVLRFNVAGDIGGEFVAWAAHGALGERPQLSMMQQIDAIAGVVDRMKDDLLIETGYDVLEPTRYAGAPTSSDLKAFGDNVLLLNRIFNAQVPIFIPWTAYTPVWTASVNPVLGNGVLVGEYSIIGNTLKLKILLLAGTTTTFGTGAWKFSIPAIAGLAINTDTNLNAGVAFPNDDSVTLEGEASMVLSASDGLNIQCYRIDGTSFTSAFPFTWANQDSLRITAEFKIPSSSGIQTIRQQLGL